MRPATAWDDADWQRAEARGWTVVGRLRERQRIHREEARAVRRRVGRSRGRVIAIARRGATSRGVTDVPVHQNHEPPIEIWRGSPSVIALLFAPPDCDAVRMLDVRGEYFDRRTGDLWDLFFPGYYRSTHGDYFENQTGARPIGHGYASDWHFSADDFNALRKHIEESSGQRWQYSGGADLVLITCWLPQRGEPTIDWESTISGQIADQATSVTSLTVANVIEQISQDLETATEDSSYGVGRVIDGPPPPKTHIFRELIVQALAGIAAALGARALGT